MKKLLVIKFIKLFENPEAEENYNQIKKIYESNGMEKELKAIENIIKKKFK
jgi:hypothetical protein